MLDWKQRRKLIVAIATIHPCATRHFIRLFASKTVTHRTIKKLHDDGLLKRVGKVISKDSGRPEHVYSNSWKPKADQIEHELSLTDFCMCFPDAEFKRGWIVDRSLKPDAEMVLDGIRFNIELDTGEQSHKQVSKRQKRYAGSTDYLLYVCQSERRLENLRKNAEDCVRSIVLFTTLAEVQTDPRSDRLLVDCFDERAPIR
jgi:hypothetical protein